MKSSGPGSGVGDGVSVGVTVGVEVGSGVDVGVNVAEGSGVKVGLGSSRATKAEDCVGVGSVAGEQAEIANPNRSINTCITRMFFVKCHIIRLLAPISINNDSILQ